MKQTVNIATIFPKHLFWDMDYSKLNIDEDKDIIIPRALYATIPETFEKDMQILESLYTREDLFECLKNTKELITNSVCEMVAKRYNIAVFYRFKI